MLVPVVRELAVSHRDIEITVLSQSKFAELWTSVAPNVRFIGADLRGRHKGIAGLERLITELRADDYDAVLDMHGVLRSRYITLRFMLTGKHTATIRKNRIGRWLLTHGWHRRPLQPMWECYAEVVDKGLSLIGTKSKDRCAERKKSKEQGDGYCEKSGIGIAPFAAHRGKQYPLEKMEEVVRRLSEAGHHIVLFGGGNDEQVLLHSWSERYDNVECADRGPGKKGLGYEIGVMRGLRLMLTMDSANMHLASLAGTRVISVWGATHPDAGFLGIGQQRSDCIQRDLRCRPCSIYGKGRCRYRDYRCLDIEPQEIIDKIEKDE